MEYRPSIAAYYTTKTAGCYFIPQVSANQSAVEEEGKTGGRSDVDLRKKILEWMHTSPQGGHSGRDATLKRLKQLFY